MRWPHLQCEVLPRAHLAGSAVRAASGVLFRTDSLTPCPLLTSFYRTHLGRPTSWLRLQPAAGSYLRGAPFSGLAYYSDTGVLLTGPSTTQSTRLGGGGLY